MRVYTTTEKINLRKGQSSKVTRTVEKHGPITAAAICRFLRKENKDCVLWHISQLKRSGFLKATYRKEAK